MKVLIFVFTLVVLSSITNKSSAFTELTDIDSISYFIKNSAVNDYNIDLNIFDSFLYQNETVVINNINKIISEAEKSHNNKVRYNAFIIAGKFYLHKYEFSQAEYYFNKALKVAKSKNIAYAKFELAEVKIFSEQYLEALEYLRQVKELISDDTDKKFYTKVLLKESFCYIQLKNYDTADEILNEAFSKIEQIHSDTILLSEYYKNVGISFHKQINYLNALAYFYKALEASGKANTNRNYATILCCIGKIYYNQKNYNNAVTCFNDALNIYKKINDTRLIASMSYEIGRSEIKLNKLKQAKTNFDNAVIFYKKSYCPKGVLKTNLKIAQYYYLTQKYNSANLILNTVKSSVFSQKELNLQYEYIKNRATIYLLTNKPDSAFYLKKQLIKYCSANVDIYTKIDCRLMLTDIYKANGNYKKALQNQTIAISLKDSIANYINSYEINILQSELESRRKEIVINTLTNERKIQEQKILENKAIVAKQKILIFSGIILTLLLVGVAILISAFLYQKRKDNKRLLRKNLKIEQQKEEIEVQKQYLMEVNEELEKLSIVARETDSGIKIMNTEGYVIWVNEGYTKMFGYTLEDLQKKEHINILGNNANVNIQQLVNVWYGDKQPITFESLHKTKCGKDIWIQTTLTPILDESGKIYRMIAIDSDISKLKKIENELLEKNKDITESIAYAQQIQQAMMPSFSIINDFYQDSYYILKPKSIVSGDFYWTTFKNNRLVVACADSTGHGVPGAFMSMIGMSFLNKIVNEKGFVAPDIILNRMRKNIITHLHQDENNKVSNDGMDMAVVSIDIENYQLDYAGAMNPIYVIRNNNLIELKPDKMPVGFFEANERPFSSTSLSLEKNDTVFMFTDGYQDQFGGKTGNKMKRQKLKDTFIKAAALLPEEQGLFIENEFYKWKGDNYQVDDVLIISLIIN